MIAYWNQGIYTILDGDRLTEGLYTEPVRVLYCVFGITSFAKLADGRIYQIPKHVEHAFRNCRAMEMIA